MDKEVRNTKQVTPNINFGSRYCKVDRLFLDVQIFFIRFEGGVSESPLVFIFLIFIVDLVAGDLFDKNGNVPFSVHASDGFQDGFHLH